MNALDEWEPSPDIDNAISCPECGEESLRLVAVQVHARGEDGEPTVVRVDLRSGEVYVTPAQRKTTGPAWASGRRATRSRWSGRRGRGKKEDGNDMITERARRECATIVAPPTGRVRVRLFHGGTPVHRPVLCEQERRRPGISGGELEGL